MYVEAIRSLEGEMDAKGERLNLCSDLPRVCERVTIFVDSKNSLKSKGSARLAFEKPHTSRLSLFHGLAGRRGNELK